MKKIIVVGSLNMDSVIETPHMPAPGETITGRSLTLVPGGKGANQAYAVGRLGGQGAMIGAVGNDENGQVLTKNLELVGMDTTGIAVLDDALTGQAFITVDDKGENSIIILAGANQCVTKEMVDEHVDLIKESDIVILQFEIPLETVEYVKDLAISMGKTLVVDPAPARTDIPDEFWKGIDYAKPNETELGILSGRIIDSMENLEAGANYLLDRGVKHVLVTLGKAGCYFATKEEGKFFEGNKVETVDTTAAGDSFTGAFAVALSEGKSEAEAIQFAQKVSSIVVTKKGAQTSIPTREEVENR